MIAVLAACDGTVTGIGRVAPPPETPLPPAPVESATAAPSEPSGTGLSEVPANTPARPAGTPGQGPGEGPGPSRGGAAEPSTPPSRIAARHLLIMYRGSRAAPPSIERTRDQALARAEEALRRIRAGEDFGKVAAEYTDEPGGARRHGDLGFFTHDQMVRPFADAAFALKVGEVSGIVETPFGFHIIQRTE